MSAELARRLIHSGASPVQVEAALFEAVQRGVSLTQAVNELYPELVELLERALDRSDFPSVLTVRPQAELVRLLPIGMCERLLAVPVLRDSRTGRVDVASVDVLDGHVASELEFHLGVPVRVLRTPFTELVSALEGLHASGIFLPGLSKILAGRGATLAEPNISERAERESQPPPSEPPIPLLRKSIAPNPPWVADAPELSFSQPEALTDADIYTYEPGEAFDEPVLSLGRPKPFNTSELAGPPWSLEFEAAVQRFESAESPEQVVTALCDGLAPVRALVFAVRNTSFDVRAGSPGLGDPAELRTISVPSGNGSLLDAAQRTGLYLGPFSQLSPLTTLEGKWAAAPSSDCYARAVNVSERPSLIVLMAGFSESTEATRRLDVLARSAGSALERIVRLRKRG